MLDNESPEQQCVTVSGSMADAGLAQVRFDVLAEHLTDWESWEAPDGTLQFITPACEHITGFGRDAFITNPRFLEGIIHPEDMHLWQRHRQQIEGASHKAEVEIRIRTAKGNERWLRCTSRRLHLADGTFAGIRFSGRDVTDRHMVLSQLQHQAWHDPLTGLPNRSLCIDRLGRALYRVTRTPGMLCAIAYIDIDRFKSVNDTLGNAAGDIVLREVARRLGTMTRSIDTVARVGGDEYVVLLEDITSEEEARLIIQRVSEAFAAPFILRSRELALSASMGMVVAKGGGADEILRNAAIAMATAKERGSTIAAFHPSMLEPALDRMQLEIDLPRALDHQEFFLAYQPICNTHTRRVTGFEALVRWQHPERGIIPPDVFIPLAEGTGHIQRLGQWVLNEACISMARWQQEHPAFEDAIMHVNLSARQLSEPGLVEYVARTLRETGLPAHALKLEVTETMLMDNPEYAKLVLQRLRELGIGICIDDFGTGYSSLSYLQQFPIDTLKVDRSFVRRMTSQPGHHKIVQAVVALAHSLGLGVVAEGVEEEEQRIMLMGLACESAQGFLFSRPVPGEAVPPLLQPLADDV